MRRAWLLIAMVIFCSSALRAEVFQVPEVTGRCVTCDNSGSTEPPTRERDQSSSRERSSPSSIPAEDSSAVRKQMKREHDMKVAELRTSIARIGPVNPVRISGSEVVLHPAGTAFFSDGPAAFDQSIANIDRLVPACNQHPERCTAGTRIATENLRNALSLGNAIRSAGGLNSLTDADQKFLLDQLGLAMEGAPLRVAIPASLAASLPREEQVAEVSEAVTINLRASDQLLRALRDRVRAESEMVKAHRAYVAAKTNEESTASRDRFDQAETAYVQALRKEKEARAQSAKGQTMVTRFVLER